MATKADFTEEEWKALEKGVTGAGMLVHRPWGGLGRSVKRPAV